MMVRLLSFRMKASEEKGAKDEACCPESGLAELHRAPTTVMDGACF